MTLCEFRGGGTLQDILDKKLSFQILKLSSSGLELALSDSLKSELEQYSITTIYSGKDDVTPTVNSDKVIYNYDNVTNRYYLGLSTTKTTNDTFGYMEEYISGNITQLDTLAELLHLETSTQRNFNVVDDYTVNYDLGEVTSGTININGNSYSIDMNNKNGIILSDRTILNVDNVVVLNSQNYFVNIIDENAVVNLSSSKINGNIIGAKGTLSVVSSNIVGDVSVENLIVKSGENSISGQIFTNDLSIQSGTNILSGAVDTDVMTIKDGTNEFSDIKTNSIDIKNGTNTFNGELNVPTLTINNGTNTFNDKINTTQINLEGGNNRINTILENTETTLTNGTLSFSSETFANETTSLNATAGTIDLCDGESTDYVINNFDSSLSVKYMIDIVVNGTTATSDTITGATVSGLVTIDDINFSGSITDDFNVQVLYSDDLTLSLNDKYKNKVIVFMKKDGEEYKTIISLDSTNDSIFVHYISSEIVGNTTISIVKDNSEYILSTDKQIYSLNEVSSSTNLPDGAVTVKINGTTYYYNPEIIAGMTTEDYQRLSNTGHVALVELNPSDEGVMYKLGEKYYGYDTTKLLKSAYTISSEENDSEYTYVRYILLGDDEKLTPKYYKVTLKDNDFGGVTPTIDRLNSENNTTNISGYTLTETTIDNNTNIPDDVIIKPEIKEGKLVTKYYKVGIKEGATVVQFENLNLSKGIKGGYFVSGSSSKDSPNNVLYIENSLDGNTAYNINGGGIIGNYGSSLLGDITSDFVLNNVGISEIYGGGIVGNDSSSVIENIVGDFISNTVSVFGDYTYGGGIIGNSSSIIGNITGDFISNDITNTKYLCGGGIIGNFSKSGTSTIGNITGNFISNNVTVSSNICGGGIIGNYSSLIADITGDFVSNTVLSGNYIYGGGIIGNYSYSSSYNQLIVGIGDISGNFVSHVVSGNYIYGGGVIGNYSLFYSSSTENVTLGNITGDFVSNRVLSGNYIYGGGIIGLCSQSAKVALGDITGDFIQNIVKIVDTLSGGGIIGNYSFYSKTSIQKMSNITGNFILNDLSTNNLYGGGIIGNFSVAKSSSCVNDITSDFISNTISGNYIYGGGIIGNYNSSSSSGATSISSINNISGDFTSNIVTVEKLLYGGGIIGNYNHATSSDSTSVSSINIINSNFYKNLIQSSSTSTNTLIYGGVIGNYAGNYGEVIILRISGEFIENCVLNTDGTTYGTVIYNNGTISEGIVNGKFVGNYAIGSTVYSASIYTSTNLTISADNGRTEFTGNYISADNSDAKLYRAIYIDGKDTVLTLNSINKGSIVLNDEIYCDSSAQTIAIKGDSTSSVEINNCISDGTLTLDKTTLKLGGVVIDDTNPQLATCKNLSLVDVVVNSGVVDTSDGVYTNYMLQSLTSSDNARYSIDISLLPNNYNSDTFTLTNGGVGTIYLSSINFNVDDLKNIDCDASYTIQIIKSLTEDAPQLSYDDVNVITSPTAIMNSDMIYAEEFGLSTTQTKNDSITVCGLKNVFAVWAEYDTEDDKVFKCVGNSTIIVTSDVNSLVGQNISIIGNNNDIDFKQNVDENGNSVFTGLSKGQTLNLTSVTIKNIEIFKNSGTIIANDSGFDSISSFENDGSLTVTGTDDNYAKITNVITLSNTKNLNLEYVNIDKCTTIKNDGNLNVTNVSMKNVSDLNNSNSVNLENVNLSRIKIKSSSEYVHLSGEISNSEIVNTGNMQLKDITFVETNSIFNNDIMSVSGSADENTTFINNGTLTLNGIKGLALIENNKKLVVEKESYLTDITSTTGGIVVLQDNLSISGNIKNQDVLITENRCLCVPSENNISNVSLSLNSNATLNVSNLTNNLSLKDLTMGSNSKITISNVNVDLSNRKMGTISAESTDIQSTALIDVQGFTITSDSKGVFEKLVFCDSSLAKNVQFSDEITYTALSPIYKYTVHADKRDSNKMIFTFSRGSSSDSTSFNSAVLALPANTQVGTYLSQIQTLNYAFLNSDMYMSIPEKERRSIKNVSRTASLGSEGVFSPLVTPSGNSGFWVKAYATFENVPLKNGPKVTNNGYGTIAGCDTNLQSIRNGFERVFTCYLGYNGSSEHFSAVDTYQNGGLLGGTISLYKGKFFNATTISAGATVGDMSTMYGRDYFTSIVAGIGNKTGYNIEFKDGRFIIQPNILLAYTMIKSFDFTNSAGVRINSDPMSAIQIAPGIKFIGNTKNGWQPYFAVNMVWNILAHSKVTANDINLPDMSIKPYVQYGIGLQRNWGDRFFAFGQALIQNCGRNGISITIGLRWAVGK